MEEIKMTRSDEALALSPKTTYEALLPLKLPCVFTCLHGNPTMQLKVHIGLVSNES